MPMNDYWACPAQCGITGLEDEGKREGKHHAQDPSLYSTGVHMNSHLNDITVDVC